MKLMIIFIAIGACFPLIALIYNKYSDSSSERFKEHDDETVKQSNKSNKQKKAKVSEMKKLINIKSIDKGNICCMNDKTRLILGISSPDIQLLTEAEIDAMEITLLQFSLSLNGAIQFFTTPTRIETKEPASKLQHTYDSKDETVDNQLKVYAGNLYNSYKNIENGHGVYIQRSFCVIGTNKRDKKRANEDIKYKFNLISEKLINSRMRVHLLSSQQCMQIFADIFQRGDNVLISKLEKSGIFELYSEGIGQVVYSDDEAQDTEISNQ